MRHGKKFNHLGRTAPHRKAMLSNMASSLILHKKVKTTIAKAKALKLYVEPLITKAKDDSTHSRRTVFSYLGDKYSVQELFSTVADKVGDRPGGYTRILKTGNRLGDNADMCLIELVDFNENLLKDAKPAKAKRSRRGKKTADKAVEAAATEDVVEDAVVVEEAVETPAEEVTEAPEVTETPKVEEAPEEPADDSADSKKEDDK